MNTRPVQPVGQGLEVARTFFVEWGLPYLREQQPQLVDRVATILCLGSDSLGNDDDLSKDHNWGPRFTMILTGEDKRRYGRRLQRDLDAAAPRTWNSHTFRHHQHSVVVESLNQYFIRLIGTPRPPSTTRGWKNTREENLYMIRHATVFHDPLGEFTARRRAFWSYPKAHWQERVWEELWKVWHYGEYNFVDRLCHRGDIVASAICLGQFTEAVMRLAMLLSGDYTPYWKWLAAEFRKVPGTQKLDQLLADLAIADTLDHQAHIVRAICDDVHARLVEQLSLDPEPKGHPHRLHLAALELKGRSEGSTDE